MRKYHILLVALMVAWTIWVAQSCRRQVEAYHASHLCTDSLTDIRPGDLLFFCDTAGMGAAVRESTGEYTHVALVERVDDTIWIIDATQRYGVCRHVLAPGCGETRFPDVYRLQEPYVCSVEQFLRRAQSFIGQPYDNAFLPDNGAMYCSELIYESYVLADDDEDGKEGGGDKHLFEAKPMNWRDAHGELPKYWETHFRQLGIPVPEGVLGTNPTDLSRSTILYRPQ